jgi:hypothetical protein
MSDTLVAWLDLPLNSENHIAYFSFAAGLPGNSIQTPSGSPTNINHVRGGAKAYGVRITLEKKGDTQSSNLSGRQSIECPYLDSVGKIARHMSPRESAVVVMLQRHGSIACRIKRNGRAIHRGFMTDDTLRAPR